MKAQLPNNNTQQDHSPMPVPKKARRSARPVETDLNNLTWLGFLPKHERKLLLDEVAPLIAAADGPGVVQLLHEWRATALIYSDSELLKKLTAPLPEDFQI